MNDSDNRNQLLSVDRRLVTVKENSSLNAQLKWYSKIISILLEFRSLFHRIDYEELNEKRHQNTISVFIYKYKIHNKQEQKIIV